MSYDALDDFAGPGGWDEGARMVGLTTVGIEWDMAACQTAKAAGHARVRADVAAYPSEPFAGIAGYIASPPCTLFSGAGTGVGNLVIDFLADGIVRLFGGDDCRAEVREAIYPVTLAEAEAKNEKRPAARRWPTEKVEAKARTDAFVASLVLEPARRIMEITPEWVALEQVPEVLPLWQVYGHELRAHGYSAWTGVLNAADFGVPQTRRRAVVMASCSRHVSPPTPSHTKHEDHGDLFGATRQPWVTLAEALDLADDLDAYLIPTNDRPNVCRRRPTEPGPTMAFGHERPRWIYNRPSTTVVGSFRPDVIAAPGYRTTTSRQDAADSVTVTVPEAGVIQSFPPDYPWQGSESRQYQQVGNAVPPLLAAHVLAALIGQALEVAA